MSAATQNTFKTFISRFLPSKIGEVQEIHIPELHYLMVDGTGEPASASFTQAIQGLYSHAYTIKFLPKSGVAATGYEPFSVAPVEGLFGEFTEGWKWTLLMVVPDFVTEETLEQARNEMRRKRKEVNESVRLEPWEEGEVIQALNLGPYDKEQPTIDKLHDYAKAHGFALTGCQHEIYLNDPRRVAPEKIKTVIRYQVVKGG